MTQLARDRLEVALGRIAAPDGEGARACLTLYSQTARASADAADARAGAGASLGPLDGVIVTIKDLFDVAGEPTRAGSTILANAAPAAADAAIVRRLRAAGAVLVAKTNMVEFAFSGIGVNPDFGTPGNPADRTRVPGGSSSGAGVAVADDMCEIAIGTDTGGSTRIPAALCGVVGFKPTKSRISTDGAFPLSPTLDSVGPLAKTVTACAAADAVLAGEPPWTLTPAALSGLRFGVAQGLPLRELDATVAARFDEAINVLAKHHVRLSDESISLFDDMAQVNAGGSIVTLEAFGIHRERIAAHGAAYDPFVRSRIEAGRNVSNESLAAKLQARAGLARGMDARLASLDALILPTTQIVAPTIAEVSTNATWGARNGQLLRNTAIVNFFDLCAISLPLPRGGGPHVGLMLVARNGHDRRLFEIAAAVEEAFLV
jgi:aspartyl-tRNA(Asn)/glutamyl-tRNA(Gln) amidotransferase subunit A